MGGRLGSRLEYSGLGSKSTVPSYPGARLPSETLVSLDSRESRLRLGSRQRDNPQAKIIAFRPSIGMILSNPCRLFEERRTSSLERLSQLSPAFPSLFSFACFHLDNSHRRRDIVERIVDDVASTSLRPRWRSSSSAAAAAPSSLRTATRLVALPCTSIRLVPAAPTPTLSVLSSIPTTQPSLAEKPAWEQQRLASDLAWTTWELRWSSSEGGAAGRRRGYSGKQIEASQQVINRLHKLSQEQGERTQCPKSPTSAKLVSSADEMRGLCRGKLLQTL